MKIGLTGGIGSGKTYLSEIFKFWNIPVYHADSQAKRLTNHDTILKGQIKQLLGQSSYHRNGRLNRAFVASQIFNDPSRLAAMNAIVHPAVKRDFEQWAAQQDSAYVLEESAILFEADLTDAFDAIILVIADLETRIQRVIHRDKTSREKVLERINNQKSDEYKMHRSDFIILNNGTESLFRQVYRIHQRLLNL